MNQLSDWTENQFITFVLIHAAYADFEICEAEKNYIKDKHGKETYMSMEKTYFELGEFERLQTILDHKSLYYNNPNCKAKIIREMEEMFKVDGAYTKLEKNLKYFFEKLL